MYSYRGTTLGYPGNESQRLQGITPTSTDPLVATYFAIECRRRGEAVVLAIRRGRIAELEADNHFAKIEKAVNLLISPADFEARSEYRLDLERAIAILRL